MFVPGKPFQRSLIFAGKAGAYPKVLHSRLGPGPYPQILDLAGKGCQEQTL
jgi:hypothetical protein